jgi:hypothetical protein
MSKKQKPKVAVKETAPYDNFMDQMREEVIVEKNDTLWGEEEKIVEDLEEWT